MDEQPSVTIRIPPVLARLWAGRGRAWRWLARQMVPNVGTLILVAVLLWVTGVYAGPGQAPETQPANTAYTTVHYQGRLADGTGNPINDAVGMNFALYSQQEGGEPIWSEAQNGVIVSDGLFSVLLGSVNPLYVELLAENLWLEIQVVPDPPMIPRERLASVPYAMQAWQAFEAQTVPHGSITQDEATFAPLVYHKENVGEIERVDRPIIYTGWFHGSDEGWTVYDLSSVFSQVDAVVVTKTRLSSGNDKVVTFMVTDASGTSTPIPSEVKISAYGPDGNLESWIQAYVVVIGR